MAFALFFNMLLPSLAQPPPYPMFPYPIERVPPYGPYPIVQWPFPWTFLVMCKDNGPYYACGRDQLKDKYYNPALGLTSDCCHALMVAMLDNDCFQQIFFGSLEFSVQVIKYCTINYAPVGSPSFLDI